MPSLFDDELCTEIQKNLISIHEATLNKDVSKVVNYLSQITSEMNEIIDKYIEMHGNEPSKDTTVNISQVALIRASLALMDVWGIMPYLKPYCGQRINDGPYVNSFVVTKEQLEVIQTEIKTMPTPNSLHFLLSVMIKASKVRYLQETVFIHFFPNILALCLCLQNSQDYKLFMNSDIQQDIQFFFDFIQNYPFQMVLPACFKLIKYEMISIARGIGSLPPKTDIDIYYKSICNQVTCYIKKNDKHLGIEMIYIIKNIYEKHPMYLYKYLYNCLFDHLNSFLKQPFFSSLVLPVPTENVTSSSLSSSFSSFIYILSLTTPPLSLIQSISIYIPLLFYIYTFAKSIKSYMSSPLRNIILTYIKLSPAVIPTLLYISTGDGLREDLHYKMKASKDGGIDLIPAVNEDKIEEESPSMTIPSLSFKEDDWTLNLESKVDWSKETSCLIDLLTVVKDTPIVGDLFIELLKEYFTVRVFPSRSTSLSINPLKIVQIIMGMIEEFQEQLFSKNIYRGLSCIYNIILYIHQSLMRNKDIPQPIHKIGYLDINEEEEENDIDIDIDIEGVFDIINICTEILKSVYYMLDDVEIEDSDSRGKTEHNHPIIQEVEETKREVQQVMSSTKAVDELEVLEKQRLLTEINKYIPLLQDIQEYGNMYILYEPCQTISFYINECIKTLNASLDKNSDEEKKKVESSLQEEIDVARSMPAILKDLSHPLPAIRSYALSRVIQIIKEQKENLFPYLDDILTICNKNLCDNDSYVYLYAIQAFTYLSDYFADKTLPLLLDRFNNTASPAELRLKIGEVIVSTVKHHGQGSIQFSSLIMNSFLTYMSPSGSLSRAELDKKKSTTGITDDDLFALQALRSSCFSNVGELCEYMKYQIQDYIVEILSHCMGVLRMEKGKENILIRRAALYLLTQVIKGSQEDIYTILKDMFPRIRQILIEVEDDNDPVLQEHARLANQYLQTASKQLFFGTNSLIEEIN
ncbi:hypothetical protein WA158_001843 [Blastocystis sp. Blastoise]